MQIHTPAGEVGTPPVELATAPTVLSGLAIGTLENGKPNAALLLDRLADRLAARTGARRGRAATKNAAVPCEDQVLESMATEVQVVLTGSAD